MNHFTEYIFDVCTVAKYYTMFSKIVTLCLVGVY